MKRLIFLSALLTLCLLQACNEGPAEVQKQVRPVKTVVATPFDMGRQWSFSGTAEDALETDLSFRVAGKIVDFPGDKIGRKFAKGQTIARLDPSDYELELRQAKANMEQVRANFVRAKADQERNRQLFEKNVISQGELDQIEADFKSYEAQLNASAKQLDIARKHLSYTTLPAPFDGWIGRVDTQVYQNVTAGQAVVTLNAGRQMKMYVAVPDTLISAVEEGETVSVTFDALPGQIMKGQVTEISVKSASGSTYPVKVNLDNKSQMIRSGMSGHVNFIGKSEGKASIYLPPAAVMSDTEGKRLVWVVDPESNTVAHHDVTVGRLTSIGLEVLSGVEKGDIVVIRGVHRLEDGQQVRILSSGGEE